MISPRPKQEVPWDSGPDADADFEAWRQGRTGYPIVDAGMRHLLTPIIDHEGTEALRRLHANR